MNHSKGAEPTFRSPRVKLLWDRWRNVWVLSWERQRRLQEKLMYLLEVEKMKNFSWDDWRKRVCNTYLQNQITFSHLWISLFNICHSFCSAKPALIKTCQHWWAKWVYKKSVVFRKIDKHCRNKAKGHKWRFHFQILRLNFTN